MPSTYVFPTTKLFIPDRPFPSSPSGFHSPLRDRWPSLGGSSSWTQHESVKNQVTLVKAFSIVTTAVIGLQRQWALRETWLQSDKTLLRMCLSMQIHSKMMSTLAFRCLLCLCPISGAARALATGVKLTMEGHPGRVRLIPKMITSSFLTTLLSKGPFRAFDGPSWAWNGPREI